MFHIPATTFRTVSIKKLIEILKFKGSNTEKINFIEDIIKNLEGDNTDEINQLKDISQNLGITIVDDIVRSMTNDLYK